MRSFEEIMKDTFADRDLTPEQVPELDLYMDQVLTLLGDGLADTKRHPDDKLITKTMINNYSKEKLRSPIGGKKYSHQHIMQILCVYQLKQTLALADVKHLTGRTDVDFESCWRAYLDIKQRVRETIPPQLLQGLDADLRDPSERLSLCLALSTISDYMRRLCEAIIDEAEQEKGTEA